MIVSIVLPYVKIVHYRGFQKVGESKYCAYRWLAHYDRSRRSCGKTTKTIFGEPNHYDRNNAPTGYSRKRNYCTYLHYNCKGQLTGYSKRILGFIWIHNRVKN